MRPTILTDDVLAEIDIESHIEDATDREPTDAPSYSKGLVESLLDCQMELAGMQRKLQLASARTWDEWVRLP